jgi:hypothetical protein
MEFAQRLKMKPWRVCLIFDEEQDPDPHRNEKSDPDPCERKKSYPDPYQGDSDPQHWC